MVLSNELDITSKVVFLSSLLGPEFVFYIRKCLSLLLVKGNACVNSLDETLPTLWQLAVCKWGYSGAIQPILLSLAAPIQPSSS